MCNIIAIVINMFSYMFWFIEGSIIIFIIYIYIMFIIIVITSDNICDIIICLCVIFKTFSLLAILCILVM